MSPFSFSDAEFQQILDDELAFLKGKASAEPVGEREKMSDQYAEVLTLLWKAEYVVFLSFARNADSVPETSALHYRARLRALSAFFGHGPMLQPWTRATSRLIVWLPRRRSVQLRLSRIWTSNAGLVRAKPSSKL